METKLISQLSNILKISLTMGCCVLAMNFTSLNYPPGCAIALIPLMGNEQIEDLGYLFVLLPSLTGITIMYIFFEIKQKLSYKLIKHGE